MATQWRLQGCGGLLLKVLWVTVHIALRVDSAPSESLLFPAAVSTNRTDDEKLIHPHISEENTSVESIPQDLFETKTDDNGPSSNATESDGYEELTKSKYNNRPGKYFANDYKNHSSNKFNVETSSNESFIDRQKPNSHSPLGFVLKYSFPNKKDSKLNTNNSTVFKTNNSNGPVPNKPAVDSLRPKEVVEVMETEVEGSAQNETNVMSDQPLEVGSDHNATELSNNDPTDVFTQNTTELDVSNSSTSADSRTMPASEGLDILMISGIVLGTVLLLGLIAGGSFAVYRHRIWNKPQTLSDKCSNADSSGYIDDSTLRENSEEMYSLDNDSFLNSLEAMTIQNYWTDNVKHTKL